MPRSAIIWTRSRKLSLNVMYHLTHKMMISWSKCRPLNRSCAEVGSVIPAVIAGYRAFQQFAPEPFLALASYRNTLRDHVSPLTFVHLDVDAETIRNRLQHRSAHFFPKELMESQFATLEKPKDAIIVDARKPLDAVVDQVIRSLGESVT